MFEQPPSLVNSWREGGRFKPATEGAKNFAAPL